MAYKLNIFTKKLDIDTMQSLTTLDSRYVNVTGDTMTGALVITPTANSTATLNVTTQAGASVFKVNTTDLRSETTGAVRTIESASGYSQFNHANALTSAYPRAYFNIFGGASITNAALYVSSGDATGTTQIPAFLGISTNSNVKQADSIQAVHYLTTSAYKIVTTKGESGSNTVPVHIGGTAFSTSDSKVIISTGSDPVMSVDRTISVGTSTSFLTMYALSETYPAALFWKSDQPFRLGTATSTAGGGFSEKMRIENTGNVGIGITSPGAKLQINTGADATIGQIIKANSATQSANLTEWQNSSGTVLAQVFPVGTISSTVRANYSGTLVKGLISSVFSQSTTTDQTALEFHSYNDNDAPGPTYVRGVGGYAYNRALTANASVNQLYGGLFVVSSNANLGYTATTSAAVAVYAQSSFGGTGGTHAVTNIYGFRSGNMGNTGVTNAYAFYADAITGATNNYGFYSAGGTNYFAGNVGIGTTSPGAKLDVYQSSIRYDQLTGGQATHRYDNDTYRNTLTLENRYTTSATDIGTGILFNLGRTGDATARNAGRIASLAEQEWTSTASTNDSAMVFSTALDGTLGEKVRITSAGNLGIGTTSPSVKLDVQGGSVIFNDDGLGTSDFRVESDTEANMLFVDANANTDGSVYLGGTTNGIEIKKGGDLTLLGTAKYERHVQIPAMLDGKVANQPTSEDFFTAGGLQFASAGAQYAYCQWEIPDDWDGTDIVFEIDWFPDSGATTGTDAVRWTVEYRSIAEGELINQGTSVTVDNGVGGDTADYAQYETKHSRFTLTYNNANQPLTNQDHVYFKISRDTSVANDFAGTVTVAAYEIIYQSKGFPTSN